MSTVDFKRLLEPYADPDRTTEAVRDVCPGKVVAEDFILDYDADCF